MPWPNDDRLGYPADTETKQFHMFKIQGQEHILVWDPQDQEWTCALGRFSPRVASGDQFEYLGPAQVRLTPDVSAETGVKDDPLSAAAHKAMKTFEEYAQHHIAKVPPNTVKAERNLEMARALAKALGL